MNVRLVAYRRSSTSDDTYDLTQFELDLQKEPNVVVNYNWLDLKNPDQRRASFSQTLKLPFSNKNNTFFQNHFDVNLDNLVFNSKTKFNAILYIDSVPQLKGFIELKSIYLNARLYEVALFGDTADFFTDLKDNLLKDAFRTQDTTNPSLYLEDSQLDHKLTLANIVNSWGTAWGSGGLTTVNGVVDNDIIYPIIDYGHTANPYSDAMFWKPQDVWDSVNELGGEMNEAMKQYGFVLGNDLKPAIRIQRLIHIIAQKAGYQIKSAFMGIDDTAGTPITDTQFFSRLFMTLSTEHDRVQSLFNTSSGSEEPFIGFKAEQSGTNTSAVGVDGFGGVWNFAVFPDLNLSEVYDPNNLFASALAGFGLDNYSWQTPCVRMPLDSDGTESLLPSGEMLVKVSGTATIASTLSDGTTLESHDVNNVYWRGGWFDQEDNSPLSGYVPYGPPLGAIEPGGTTNIEATVVLPVIPGKIYFFMMNFTPDALINEAFGDPAVYLDVTINNFTIETVTTNNTALMGGGLNGEVQMYHNMPEITQADFVKDLVNRFNLIIKTDGDNEKLLLIEPYNDFIEAGTTKYWTDKLDVSKEQIVKPTNDLQSKHLKFSDLEDEDILNQRYISHHNMVYGEYNEHRRNDFASEMFENFSVMSPFIAQGIGQWGVDGIQNGSSSNNVAVAYLFKAEAGEEAAPLETTKPKLFYYSGTPVDIVGTNQITGNAFEFNIYSAQYMEDDWDYNTNNKFPLCLQYNLDTLGDITADTKILNWTYYSPGFNSGFTFNVFGGVYTKHGYYYDYWATYINEIYSDESRIMECYLNLSPVDILTFAGSGFQNKYYIKNTLWRIINIQGYLVGGNKSTKVTLLKADLPLPIECGATPTIGIDGSMTWVDSATGASTTITNACCEEENEDWTFVQTNAVTGVGDCYANLTEEVFEAMPMPTLPNIQTQYNILNSPGNGYTTTFYIQATTLDATTVTNFSYSGIQPEILQVPTQTMNYVKVSIVGSIVTGTNVGKCGYFEYDTILVSRDDEYRYIGTAGGTLLKTNKDGSFSVPTLGLTTYKNKFVWSPTIQGGASESVNWIAKVEIIRQDLGSPDAELQPGVKALYQNNGNILLQDLTYLLWN
jgi:hypothetical protein